MAKVKDNFVGSEAMLQSSRSYENKNILDYETRQIGETTSGSTSGLGQTKNKSKGIELSYDEWKDNSIAPHI